MAATDKPIPCPHGIYRSVHQCEACDIWDRLVFLEAENERLRARVEEMESALNLVRQTAARDLDAWHDLRQLIGDFGVFPKPEDPA
jgi:hypothetical protein